MQFLYEGLYAIMKWCYGLLGNYGLAIILFTLITKVILIPVTAWTYKESIKMIKIQPDVNLLKARYFGQKDIIAEEEAKLYKKEKYHPLVSLIPLAIQLVLLLGVVGAVRMGIEDGSINMDFMGVDLSKVPAEEGLSLIWSPIAAAVSAWLLCVVQNRSNVLQAEQGKINKYGTMIFSVALSLYLGWFVPVGVAFYWIWSNIFAIIILYIMNLVMKPRKYVDYDKLEYSRKKLAEMTEIGKKSKKKATPEEKRREKADYKRFFSVVNKHLVFYSESNGFFKYYKGYFDYIINNTNITIHYITSDPDDQIFRKAEENNRIRAYYIGETKLITLMMKMDADVVVMTMPDLENYHIKRSYVRKDIEYIFIPHGMGSNNLTMRKGSVDNFDTVFCAGIHQKEETIATEKVYGLKAKTLVEAGYPLIDDMRRDYRSREHKENDIKNILIAPSWQNENIVDSCLEKLLEVLKGTGCKIIVRPHPQEVRLKADYMEQLKEKYASDAVEIQTDFSSNNPVMDADLLITDWSDIAWEYAFTTLRPVLFINTPMKIMNPEYEKIDIVPFNIYLRDKVGTSLDTDKLDEAGETAMRLMAEGDRYKAQIEELAGRYIYNLDNSSEIGAKYIIDTIMKKISRKEESKDEK